MKPLIFGKELRQDTGILRELNPIKIQLYLSDHFRNYLVISMLTKSRKI